MGSSMIEEMRKKSIKSILPVSIIMIALGIVFLVVFAPDFFTYIKGPVDFNSLTIDEVKDQFVKVDYNYNYGCFAEETTTRTRNGVKVSEGVSSKMNTIVFGGIDSYFQEGAGGFEYIGICFKKKDFNTIKKVDENVIKFFSDYEKWYYDYTYPTEDLLSDLSDHYEFTGQIVKMDDKMYGYYKSFFLEDGYTTEEFEKYCSPYYIKVGCMKNGDYGMIIFMFILSIILIVGGALIIISAATGGNQKKLIKELNAKSANGLARAESDYARATTLCKGYKLGKEYLFCIGAGSAVHSLDEFLWAYIHQTTHKTYFITTGKSFSVNVCKDNKKSLSIATRSQSEAALVLDTLQKQCPGLIAGYSDDIARTYRNNIQEMINYRNEKRAEAGL